MLNHEEFYSDQTHEYETIEAAAAAFGRDFYGFTRITGRECGANLYAHETEGQTRYYYADVRFGSKYSVGLPLPTETWTTGNATYVGCVHTHPKNRAFFSEYDVVAFHRMLDCRPQGKQFEAFLVPSDGVLIRFVDAPRIRQEAVQLPKDQ